MTNLIVVVEGDTEAEFVKRVLAPHLAGVGLIVHAIRVYTSFDRKKNQFNKGGGRSWSSWASTLGRLQRQFKHHTDRFTTLIDLYAIPTDTPGFQPQAPDTRQHAQQIEAAIGASNADPRLIPYVQRHEIEALVLAALDELNSVLLRADQRAGLAALRLSLGGMAPEDVNDGPTTAPSKRLVGHIPSYRKASHGPEAMEAAGLAKLRAQCPRFHQWVAALEALGAPVAAPPHLGAAP